MSDFAPPIDTQEAVVRSFAPRLLTNFASNSSISEAYRIVRTGLLTTPGAESGGTVLVTSAGRGEGKSLTVANLAIVLSRTEQRVAIVDADLRLPTLHKLFGVEPGSYASLLEAPGAADDAVDPGWATALAVPVLDQLSIVAAGAPVRQPSELLASSRFASFLEALRASFDIVLIDSPPVNIVTDAAVLASRVDATLFVLDFMKTKRADARRAVSVLRASDANIVGSVINRQPARRDSTYGAAYGG